MKKKRLLLFLFFIFSFFSGFVYAETSDTTVTVEGYGTDYNSALNDARRKAVEEAVGVYIESTTLVENLKLISDIVKAQTTGFIVPGSEEVLSKWQEGNAWFVRLRATVSKRSLQQVLPEIARYYLVRIPETIYDEQSDMPVVEGIMRQYLVDNKIDVVEPRKMFQKPVDIDKVLAGDQDYIADIGLYYLVNTLVVGRVKVEKRADMGEDEIPYEIKDTLKGVVVAEANLEVTAVDCSTGMLIASYRSKPGEFRGFGLDWNRAAGDALDRASEGVKNWFVERLSPKMVIISVSGVQDFSEFLKLKKAVDSCSGVIKVEGEFQKGKCDLKILYRGGDYFALAEGLTTQISNLEISSVSSEKIDCKWQ
jgi:hypothetical protein